MYAVPVKNDRIIHMCINTLSNLSDVRVIEQGLETMVSEFDSLLVPLTSGLLSN